MIENSVGQRASCAKWRSVKSEILFNKKTGPDWDEHLNDCLICSHEKEQLLKSVEKAEDLIPKFSVDKKLQEMFERELDLLWSQHQKLKKVNKKIAPPNLDRVGKNILATMKNMFLDRRMYRLYVVFIAVLLAYRYVRF